MQTLSLIPGSKASLTKTELTPDPNKKGQSIASSYRCDLKGDAIPAPGLPIYKDAFSGLTFVRIAENIPSTPDSVSVAAADVLLALDPVFYVSPDGSIRGWFVEAPDFNSREAK